MRDIDAWSLKDTPGAKKKNEHLRRTRNISFEEIVASIADGRLLDIVEHPNSQKYKDQRIFVVEIHNYAWLVPFVETQDEVFLKTIIPNRKATRKYLGDENDVT